MGFTFKKATKLDARLRLALMGPSGSGKTFTALAIATALGKRVAVIDTERGSASKYAELFAFDVLELETFAPATYVEAMNAAAREGYDVIVIDSLSHAWMGKDGALEMVDRVAARSNSKNSFDAWRSVTPHHNALVDAMLRLPAHLLVTMRVKTEYVLEEDSRGKKVPRKVGLQPVQRDGLEYEFDVVADLDLENRLVVSKTRCPELAEKVFQRAGADVARILTGWLSGAPRPESPAQPARPPADDPSPAAEGDALLPQLAEFYARCAEIELPGEGVAVWMKHRATLATLASADREAAWKALCRTVEKVGKMAKAAVWLKKAIAEEDARRSNGIDPQAVLPDAGAPRAETPRSEPVTLTDIFNSIRMCTTVGAVTDRLRAARAETQGWSRGERESIEGEAVARVADIQRCSHKAAREWLDKALRGPRDDGPNGGGKAPASDAAPANAHGGSVDANGGAHAAPVALVPTWASSREAAMDHIEKMGIPLVVENSCRKYRTGIPEYARDLMAKQLQRMSYNEREGELALDCCRRRVDRWIAEGKIATTVKSLRGKGTQRTAGGAR